ncbi:MAG: hypothetical protein JNK74_08580 [Candidatus Hydrogenedentes bacterium]|nr:hypothetical protein [Candidatus Hydrogenedentota bacterium]
MKKFIGCLLFALVALGANAGQVVYVSSFNEPWNLPGNVNSLNDVFGAGNWGREYFSGFSQNGVLQAGGMGDFIFMDGGDGATAEFESFVNTNRTLLETFVSGGGSLFINAARWGGTSTFNLGFGVNLVAAGLGHSSTFNGTAVDPGHAIFTGPFGPTGTAWTGGTLSHDFVTGAGLTNLMIDSYGRATLAEMGYGSGHVLFGGLTLPYFGGPDTRWSAGTGALHRNILRYVADPYVAPVLVPGGPAPVPVPAAGGLGLLGMGLVSALGRRKKSPQA